MRAPDRVVTAVDDRKSVIVEVIRNARETIVLSLFRCNDTDIFDELARATKRGVKVEALMTSRAKGGKKRLRKLWDALEAAGVSPTSARASASAWSATAATSGSFGSRPAS